MPAEPRQSLRLATALWRTRSYLLPQWRHFVAFALLSGLAMLLGIGTPLLGIDLLTNGVFLAEPLTELQARLLALDVERYAEVERLAEDARLALRNVVLVVICALFAAGFLLGSALSYYLTWILQRVNQHLRLAMMDAATRLSLREHQERKVGDAIYRIYQDSAMVTAVVQNALVEPVVALGNLAIALVAVALFHPYLGLLFLLAALPSLLAAAVLTPRLRRQSAAARAANSDLTSHIQESTAAARLLQANGAESAAFGAFRSRSRAALDRAYELRRSVAVLNLAVFLCTAIAAIGADYLMVTWVWDEAPTFGFGLVAVVGFAVWNLGAFQAARERNVSISGAAVSLAAMWSLLQDMGMGLGRAFVLLDLEPEVADPPWPTPMPAVRRGVAFEEVRFGYRLRDAAPEGREVLRGVSFEAAPGTTTAIVGASGAGKSTLMRLLLRLYDVDGGAIRIDGVDIRRLRLADLRAAIAVVLQENVLFPTSIADNVRYATPNATEAQLAEAARAACAEAFIAALPSGFETVLGERGAKLSTGERQRISMARAIIKNTPILILDEPTAALDVATEQRVVERLAAHGRDKVMFFVTHRLATIRRADRILFLEDGKVAEQGDYATLMAAPNGRFRRFAGAEFEAA